MAPNYLNSHHIRQAIIGCTDISPCVQWQTRDIHWVDSTDVLAKQAIKVYLHLT